MVDNFNSEAARKGRQKAAKTMRARAMTPKFEIGDKIGDLQIVSVTAHKTLSADPRGKSWHYMAICKFPHLDGPCGNIEEVSQKSLTGKKHRTRCRKCAGRRRHRVDYKRPERMDMDFSRFPPVPDSIREAMLDPLRADLRP